MEYTPDLKSLRKHKVPGWYHDAKFGIFVHWSLSSIPAFAVVGKGDITEVMRKEGFKGHFKNNPYAEWYLNTLRIEGSPTQQYHKETFGDKCSYYDFAPIFNESIKKWDPNEWADLFQKVGARYVVLVTKHHDGFLLWPSQYKNPHRDNYFASRDVVGELTAAVRERNMKMGFYYSGALDWTFNEAPIKDFLSFVTNGSLDPDYAKYVENHWQELITLYKPSILWNDIGYPPTGKERELFAFFYNRTPEGVINDRWMKLSKNIRRMLKFRPLGALVSWLAKRSLIKGGSSLKPAHCDYVTPEYAYFKKIKRQKWESVRGIGNSFGYNKMEPDSNYLTLEKLVHMFIDIVSKNGNLLLNVGPMADGTIPEIQKNLLLKFGEWLDINGEGLFETHPWIRAEGQTLDALEIRYTQKRNVLYAFLLAKPLDKRITIKSLIADKGTIIQMLGHPDSLEWEQSGDNLIINTPKNMIDAPAYGFKLNPKPENSLEK
jgi:alpha-L-fucosidase